MNEVVEDRLQKLLYRQAGGVVAGGLDPVPGVQRRSRTLERRRWAGAATALLATAAVVVSAAVLQPRPSTGRPGVPLGVSGASATSSAAVIPPRTVATADPDLDKMTAKPSQPDWITRKPASGSIAVPTPAGTRPEIIRAFLETDPRAREGNGVVAVFGGSVYCGINIVGESADRTEAYVWAVCLEFYGPAESVKLGSGVSMPMKLTFSGLADTAGVTSLETPPHSADDADLLKMFPEEVIEPLRIAGHVESVDQTRDQLLARARADAARSAPSAVASSLSAVATPVALAIGDKPRSDVLVGFTLTGPGRADRVLDSIPTADSYPLLETPQGTIVRRAEDATSAPGGVTIVRRNGKVDTLVSRHGGGIAADRSRMAYSVQVVKGNEVGGTLILVDLATGKELQRLEGAPNANPVSFAEDRVLLTVGDGAMVSVGWWDLATNTFTEVKNSVDAILVDANRSAALTWQQNGCGMTVTFLENLYKNGQSCSEQPESGRNERFMVLSPDSSRYAGTQSDYHLDGVPGPWPVVADAAGRIDDRLRATFAAAGLTVDANLAHPVVWEDHTHLLVVASVGDRTRPLVVRCDVDAATCEIALDPGKQTKIQLARQAG